MQPHHHPFADLPSDSIHSSPSDLNIHVPITVSVSEERSTVHSTLDSEQTPPHLLVISNKQPPAQLLIDLSHAQCPKSTPVTYCSDGEHVQLRTELLTPADHFANDSVLASLEANPSLWTDEPISASSFSTLNPRSEKEASSFSSNPAEPVHHSHPPYSTQGNSMSSFNQHTEGTVHSSSEPQLEPATVETIELDLMPDPLVETLNMIKSDSVAKETNKLPVESDESPTVSISSPKFTAKVISVSNLRTAASQNCDFVPTVSFSADKSDDQGIDLAHLPSKPDVLDPCSPRLDDPLSLAATSLLAKSRYPHPAIQLRQFTTARSGDANSSFMANRSMATFRTLNLTLYDADVADPASECSPLSDAAFPPLSPAVSRENGIQNRYPYSVSSIPPTLVRNLPREPYVPTENELSVAVDALLITGQEDPPTMRHHLRIMKRFAIAKESLRSDEALAPLLTPLLSQMAWAISDEGTQSRGLLALWTILRGAERGANRTVSAGGVKTVLSAMAEHTSSTRVTARAVAVLCVLASHGGESARTEMVANMGVERVTWAMRDLAEEDRSVSSHGAAALAALTGGFVSAAARAGRVGAVDALVGAMHARLDDTRLQAGCCAALAAVVAPVQANRWIAARVCAVETVVKSLRAAPEDPACQRAGCAALAALATDGVGENAKRGGEVGAIEAVCSALILFGEDGGVASEALRAVRALCSNDGLVNAKSVALDPILRVIHVQRFDTDVVRLGCEALRAMLLEPVVRGAITEMRGIDLLAQTLRDGMGRADICEAAVGALANAAVSCTNGKQTIGRVGGIAAIVAAMAEHLDRRGVQEQGCRALRNVVGRSAGILNARLAVECGAMDSAVFAMMGYMRFARVQEHACALLSNVLQQKAWDGREDLESSGRLTGVQMEAVVERTAMLHKDDGRVFEQAQLALQGLRETARRNDEALRKVLGRRPARRVGNHDNYSLVL